MNLIKYKILMKLRIARKITKYMGHGYPINNIKRLEKAISVCDKACKRYKRFKRNVRMRI